MKQITSLFCTAAFSCSALFSFAGVDNVQLILPGDHTPKHFKMASNVTPEDYLPNTIIFKVKPQYRQNCKVNSVDNLLPLQDFLNSVSATNLAKIYPHVQVPKVERNALGQKYVDLSLIYSFKFNSSLNLEKTINGMLSLGYFEYVEPWYVPKITGYTPNDASLSSQYHLLGTGVLGTGSINAENAWALQKGNANVVLGLTDTGTEPTHPDLSPNLYHNTADPIDGVDNDGDGYIDDYTGWDVGDVSVNPLGDNDPTWQGNNHGCATSGDACAATDNSIGVASPGFNTKFIECKIADATGALVAAYQGIQWLADFSISHGNIIKVMSNSWGGPGGGSYGQDIINYATINANILVCASAGNDGVIEQLYPSSYINVYRVAASTNTDVMANFSSYGPDVAWAAPGNNIYSTLSGTSYGSDSGTSMACPVSAGAAAIVEAQLNYSNAFQIGEKLKQTCTPMTSEPNYTSGNLGKGRIDMYKALTVAAKSIIANPITVTDGVSSIFMPGDTLDIHAVFTNYLDACSSAAAATLSIVSGGTYATVLNGNFTIGALTTLGLDSNTTTPFKVKILNTAPINQVLQFKIHIVDGTFTGDQLFSVSVNPDYINITVNDAHTTITSWGRIGYNNDGQANGLGFEYENPTPNALLYESSLMIGVSSTKVSDMFRVSTAGNTSFSSATRAHIVTPTVVSDFDVDGTFNDSHSTSSGPIPVTIHHSAYAWTATGYRKFVIVKYVIINTGASALSNLYAGIMSDWDVPNANSGQDKAAWDAGNNMGYVNYVNGPLWAATKVLTSSAPSNCYVIDNVSGGNGGIDASSTFAVADKYKALSTARLADGFTATGGDVMNCVSSGPFTINAGDSVTVAFALIGGDNLGDIQNSACMAQQKWDNTGACALGVNNLTAENFTMEAYPNPSSTLVNISYNIPGNNSASLNIIDAHGQTVIKRDNISAGKNTLSVDVSKLSTGNYLYQMRSGDAVLSGKLMIVR